MNFGRYAILAIVVVVIMAAVGILFFVSAANAEVVKAGDNVSVYYTGSFTNGTVFGSNVGQAPLNFTVGAGQLIPGFDFGVVGMRLDQNKTITVTPQEGYGEVNSSLFVSVPVNAFGVNSTANIIIGTPVTRIANGIQEHGVIAAVGSNDVTVNFNSPLAGHTLVFKIEVVAIHKP
jgi:FKBP-type peptidyl-prolyl cis-trans isomerase 2